MRVWARAGLVLALGAAVATAGCGPSRRAQRERPSPKAQTEKEEPNLPQHVRLKGGKFVLAAPNGKRLWEGEGESFEWDAQANTATLKDAKGDFFEEGKVVLKAAAPRIRVDYGASVVYLEQGVRAESAVTGASFRADRAEWRARKQEVSAAGNVNLVHRQSRAEGDRLTADTALRHARLEGEPVMLRIAQGAGKALW